MPIFVSPICIIFKLPSRSMKTIISQKRVQHSRLLPQGTRFPQHTCNMHLYHRWEAIKKTFEWLTKRVHFIFLNWSHENMKMQWALPGWSLCMYNTGEEQHSCKLLTQPMVCYFRVMKPLLSALISFVAQWLNLNSYWSSKIQDYQKSLFQPVSL